MIYALVGSSGSGKTTIGESFFGKGRELLSFTTRPIRQNEQEGVDYLFITKDVFHRLKVENKLVEETDYAGNFYGLTKKEVESKIAMGYSYAVVDMQGAKQLKEQYPEHVVIVFIKVDIQQLENRLSNGDRNETPEFIANRLALFDKELKSMIYADYVITNNTSIEKALNQLKTVFTESEGHCKI